MAVSVSKKIILIDGNAIIFRAFYATSMHGALLKTSTGHYTNALVPFVRMIKQIIKNYPHTHLLVFFDTGKPSFRSQLASDYKANRKSAPIELIEQFSYCYRFLDAAKIKYERREGYEADDLIGSYAKQLQKQGFNVDIFTGDKDLLQLIDENIRVNIFLSGAKFIDTYDEDNMVSKTLLSPVQYKEMMALAGDPSDNIHGLPGVGSKTSIRLLQEFGSIDGIYQNINAISKPKLKQTFIENKDHLLTDLALVTILTNLQLTFSPSELVYGELVESNELVTFYQEFQMAKELANITITSKQNYLLLDQNNLSQLLANKEVAFYIKGSESNYHRAQISYLALAAGDKTYLVSPAQKNLLFPLLTSDKHIIYVYDYKQVKSLLAQEALNFNGNVFDLMLASYLNNPAYGAYELEELAVIYQGPLAGKQTDEKMLATIRARQILTLGPIIKNQLIANNLLSLYENLELPLSSVLFQMEQVGVPVDEELLKAQITIFQKKVHEIIADLQTQAPGINLNSPKQLATLLYDTKGLPRLKQDSTAQDVLEKLAASYPLVSTILTYRKYNKVLSTYLLPYQELLIKGHIHTIYTQTIAQTGRLSSVAPNMQNIPQYDIGREIRKIFVAPQGYFYLSLDYSQIELRVLAYMANDKVLLDAFEAGRDIHQETAVKLFNKTEISAQERRIAKAVNFGIIYGQGAFGLADELNISLGEAKNLLTAHAKHFATLHSYLNNVVQESLASGYSYTLSGRMRLINAKVNDRKALEKAKRLALNSPIQGSAADIIKEAMLKIANYLNTKHLESKLVLQIHDELIFLVKESERFIIPHFITLMCENNYHIPLSVSQNEGKDLTFNA